MFIKATIFCLALNVYYETRGEPEIGQLAASYVVLNRVKERQTNACREVFRKKQFSWTNKSFKIPNKKDKDWIKSIQIAKLALKSKDNTNGATFYFNPKKAKNTKSITTNCIRTIKIGNHHFYKSIKRGY